MFDDHARALLKQYGFSPDILAEVLGTSEAAAPQVAASGKGRSLSDLEWSLIARYLPSEASQIATMPAREFFEAVLRVSGPHGRWSDLAQSEPVRRRFARWAHRGVWQALGEIAPTLELPPDLQDTLVGLAKRAAILAKRKGDRPSV